MLSRVTVIVLDGLGVGELPDAVAYGAVGSNTLGHVADTVGGLALPTLAAVGVGFIGDFPGIQRGGHAGGGSVFQIACHEQVVPVDELYRTCRAARKVLVPPHQVARVIARPFNGKPRAFVRTERRRDFSVEPPGQSLLDVLTISGQPVVAIGKIADLFTGRGVTRSSYTGTNAASIDETLRALKEVPRGLIFTNLVDFDTLFAHRHDVSGYAKALEEFDARVPELVGLLRHGDVLC